MAIIVEVKVPGGRWEWESQRRQWADGSAPGVKDAVREVMREIGKLAVAEGRKLSVRAVDVTFTKGGK